MNEATTVFVEKPIPAGSLPAIVASGLTLRYGTRTVLDNVTFELAGGSVLGLVGRNGAGKTSLLHCLLGLTAPTSGQSRVLGCPSLDLDNETKGNLGFVGQTPELFEWLRVREHVSLLGPMYPNFSASRAQDLLRRFEVPDLRAGKLSPGERQRLAIVLALMHRPTLLIFDEPVASLDPMARRDFLRALIELDADDAQAPTVVISSHLLEDLERVATHLLFLREGRVQLMGDREELAENIVAVYSESPPSALPGEISSHRLESGGWRTLLDRRVAGAAANGGEALALTDLFLALNS